MRIYILLSLLFIKILLGNNFNNFCFYTDKNKVKQGNLIIYKNNNNSKFLYTYNNILNIEKNFKNNQYTIKNFLKLLKKFDNIIDNIKINNTNKILKSGLLKEKIYVKNKSLKKQMLDKMSNIANIKYYCFIKENKIKYNLIFKIDNIKNKINQLYKILKNKKTLTNEDIKKLQKNLIYIKEVVFVKK